MSRISYEHKLPQQTITDTESNSVFAALKANTDGTAGRIDSTNLRASALTSKHLNAAVHANIGTVDTGSVTAGTTQSSGHGGAATAWVDIADVTLSAPLLAHEGDVVRWMFNPLVGNGTVSGGNQTKAQQVYYWRVMLLYNTGGGTLTTVIQQPVGYGMCVRSGNDASTGGGEGDIVAAWCRNALTGIWINRGQAWTIEGVRLQFRWAVNDHASANNTIDTCHVNGAVVLEEM